MMKAMEKAVICVHVFPKKNENGEPILHIVDQGAAGCFCEPICEVRFDPKTPNIPILIIIHRQDLIGVEVLGHLPPPSLPKRREKDKVPPTDGPDEDCTPPPRWA